MTHASGDSFIRQRCNQCRHPVAEYCQATSEYLCEPCFEFAVETVERDSRIAAHLAAHDAKVKARTRARHSADERKKKRGLQAATNRIAEV